MLWPFPIHPHSHNNQCIVHINKVCADTRGSLTSVPIRVENFDMTWPETRHEKYEFRSSFLTFGSGSVKFTWKNRVCLGWPTPKIYYIHIHSIKYIFTLHSCIHVWYTYILFKRLFIYHPISYYYITLTHYFRNQFIHWNK